MNKESVGKLFKGNFGTYECIAYSEKPSVVMKNISTGESISVVIDSNYAKTFEIIEEDKKIERIGEITFRSSTDNIKEEVLLYKINEIIDCINKENI